MIRSCPMAWLAFVLIFAFAGCSTQSPLAWGTPVSDQASRDQLIAHLNTTRHLSFIAVHRAVVTRDSMDEPMTGYLTVSANGDLHLVVLHDFGGTLFELTVSPATEPRITNHMPVLTEEILRRGPFNDLLLLYAPLDSHDLIQLFRDPADQSLHLIASRSKRHDDYQFDPRGDHLLQIRRYIDQQLDRSIHFTEIEPAQGLPGAFARSILIRNPSMNYTVQIRAISLQPPDGGHMR